MPSFSTMSTRADCERLDAAWKNSRRQKKPGRLDDEKLAHRIHATELSIGPDGIAGATTGCRARTIPLPDLSRISFLSPRLPTISRVCSAEMSTRPMTSYRRQLFE